MLVLLDLNGVLCCKVPFDYGCVSKPGVSVSASKYKFILRPGVREFFDQCRGVCKLAIYSSTKLHNIQVALNALLTAEQRNQLLFIADRSVTLLDPDYGTNANISDYSTIKNLSCIWSHPIYNAKRCWNASNTLLVDNDEFKVRFNDPANVLVVDEWSCKEECKDFSIVSSTIFAKLNELKKK